VYGPLESVCRIFAQTLCSFEDGVKYFRETPDKSGYRASAFFREDAPRTRSKPLHARPKEWRAGGLELPIFPFVAIGARSINALSDVASEQHAVSYLDQPYPMLN